MNKKLLKVAVTTALTVAFAVPAFANPFSDVEQGHWAYDAVENLAEAGIIEGYGDDTFKGEQNITRYEMAQMVAKALNQDLNGEQKATVERLAREFSSELNDMGIEIDELKAEQDRLKVTGDARLRFGAVDGQGDDTDFRARVSFDGKINDGLAFNTHISSGNIAYDGENDGAVIDTANVSFDALGLNNTIGRQDLLVGNGMIIDDTINGVASEIGGLQVFYGNQASEKERLYGAQYQADIFKGLNLNYIKADAKEDKEDKEFYGMNTAIGLGKNMTVNAEYAKENKSGDDAVAYGVSFDKLGLSATYKDVEAKAHTSYSATGGDINNISFLGDEGYKGMEYKLSREIADNTMLTVAYQDFENQDGSKKDDRTAAYLNVSF